MAFDEKEYGKKYRMAHADERKEYTKAYFLNPVNVERRRKYNKMYRESLIGKIKGALGKHKYTHTEKGKYAQKKYRAKVLSTQEGKLKNKARKTFAYAKDTGKLHKQPCSVCGEPQSEGHHPDYSKPLYIVWLCPKHHVRIHNKLRKLRKL